MFETDDTLLTDDSITDPPETSAEEQEAKPPEKEKEEDVTKLDLTQPEHLKTFKSSYEKKSHLLEEAESRVSTLEQELDTLRSSQGKGVYLDTNVPLEDFNPDEALTRMMEEDPEYYERVAASFMSTHFWPSVAEEFKSVEERQLNDADENDRIVLDQMLGAWDVMSRRIAGVDGNTLFGILDAVAKSPDIKEELMNRAQGRSIYNPETPFTASGVINGNGVHNPATPPQYGQPPVQVQSVQEIAMKHNLDPSEPGHLQLIKNMQAEQQAKQNEQSRIYQMQQTHTTQMQQMQAQIESMKQAQLKSSTVTDEEAMKRAEQRLNEQIVTSLKTDIQTRYANAVPKDKPYLLDKLQTLAQSRLNADPTYQQAKATAVKWFKQSASAKNATDRDRWDQKGMDALAAMVPIRLRAIDAEAQELLGTANRRVDEKMQKTANRQPAREITQTGKIVPPRSEKQPAPVGDINAAKNAIKDRARQAGLLNR